MKFAPTYNRLPKWQQKMLATSVKDAIKFLTTRYAVFESDFKDILIKPSNTCRFAKYRNSEKRIRLNLKSNTVYLYDRATLQKKYNYDTEIKVHSYGISYTCQLIHEATHFLQYVMDVPRSEVETTENEILYLKSIGIII